MSDRQPVRHVIRIYSEWFDLVADGTKTAEVRKHDRDYQIGDRLVMVEERMLDVLRAPHDRPRVIEATVSHILPASVFPEGLHDRYSVLSLVDVSEPRRMAEGESRETLEGAR